MVETTATVKIDEKGRIVIPKGIRKAAKLQAGSSIKIRSKGKTVILEQIEPVADKYFGSFKVSEWPSNLDDYAIEVKKKWQKKSVT